MLSIDLDPTTNTKINLKLFKNVTNTSDLKQQLLTGQLQCCLVNPKLILDQFQVIVATNKAVIAENLTTKSMYTEILFNLSISKNITKSLQQFGINDDCKELLLVEIVKNSENNADRQKIEELIQGEEIGVESLRDFCDKAALQKIYKVGNEELKASSLLDSIVSRIATKDFITF